MKPFPNREAAGRELAARLREYALPDPIVLALPRGGVEVGFEIARILNAPLDIVPARKLGAPVQPELAFGAIAPGASIVNQRIVRELGLSSHEIAEVIAEEEREMNRRGSIFRSGRPPLDVRQRTAIIVDDGLATGATAVAAIRSVRSGQPRAVVLAVPVGAPETVAMVQPEVELLICLLVPADFRAVGQWYEDFDQTTDERVIELLERSAAPIP